MRKTTLLTLALSFFIILPVTAQQLGKVWNDFQAYSEELKIYMQNNISDLRPLEIQAQSAVTEATGDLNIPNPITASDRISNDISSYSLSSGFENNPLLNSSLYSNEINRLIIRSSITSLLGQNGQIRTKIKLEETERGLDEINALSNDDNEIQRVIDDLGTSLLPSIVNIGIRALSPVKELDLQFQQTKIQREQSKILAENLAQTIQTNQSLQYSNLNLANLSQQMEDTNRARRVDSSTEAARLLRTTSQTDLFGRKPEN